MKKSLLRLCLMMAVFLTAFSCRNEDLTLQETKSQRNSADFFKHKTQNGISAKSGADYISILEAYNREKNFLAQMPDQEGMPIWEKMKVMNSEKGAGIIIPLSSDNETLSSLLMATLDSENRVTGVFDYDNAMLKDIVYESKIERKIRERMFYTFMYMDNRVFGTEQFTGIPEDLFKGKKRQDYTQRMYISQFKESDEAVITENASGKIIFIETTCGMVHSCTHHGGGGACDMCGECYYYSCDYIMVYIPEGGNDFPTALPTPPGGGGQSTTPIPDPDPCGLSKAFYRLAPNCNGNPDVPDLSDLEDPCSKIKNKFSDTKFKEKFNQLNKPENFDLDHELAFLIRYPPVGTNIPPSYFSVDMPPCSTNSEDAVMPSNSNGIVGVMHTHNNADCSGGIPAKVPSPGDIKYFLNTLLSQANQYTGSYSNAYSITVTSGGSYMLVYTGLDYPGSINYDTKKQLNEDYRSLIQYLFDTNRATQPNIEREFLKFMKEKVNKPGLEVYKITPTSSKKLEYDPNSPNSVKEIPCL